MSRMFGNKRICNEGFTLIEIMVAVSIFVVVLVVALGSIITIIDANKKAQAISTGISNFNLAFEGLTRSVKTGTNISVSADGNLLQVDTFFFPAQPVEGFQRIFTAKYTIQSGNGYKYLARQLFDAGDGSPVDDVPVAMTSPDIDITDLRFSLMSGAQPRVLINMKGTVKGNQRVKDSEFDLQTTISPRTVDFPSI